jgi:hypothetical protein
MKVSYAVEGWTDEAVAEKLLRLVGCEPWRRFTARGVGRLDPKLPGYNASARRQPWLVLRDLDAAECPPTLVQELVGTVERRMALRIPVRQVESWLIADHEAVETFFSVRAGGLPDDPDALADAKATLVHCCARSRRPDVRKAMVPSEKGRRRVGPEFEAWIRQFVEDAWDPERARTRSPSLDRAINRLVVLRRTTWSA